MAHIAELRVVLAVRDLAASTRFYIDRLGFHRDFGDASDAWSFLSRDAFKVMLGECPDEVPAAEIGNHSYVAYLLVDDVDGLHADLVRRGVPEMTAPTDEPWGLREFAIRTPDGHRIRFGQPIHGGVAHV